jgi:hypothetical protein
MESALPSVKQETAAEASMLEPHVIGDTDLVSGRAAKATSRRRILSPCIEPTLDKVQICNFEATSRQSSSSIS